MSLIAGTPYIDRRWLGALASLFFVMSACNRVEEHPTERTIEVVARDYAFQAPDTVDPGKVTFVLRNDGSVRHEMILMKLKQGVTLQALHAAYERDESFRPFLDGGNAVLFASAGTTGSGRLTHPLTPESDYVLWCNFTDTDSTPQHARLGMFKQIHVRSGSDQRAAPPVRQLVVDAGDYHFRAPDTVTAGVTEILMRNMGTQRHELSLSLLKAGTSPSFYFSQYLKGADVDSLYDDDGVILTAYSGDDNATALRVEFVAGRAYVIVCEFRDTPTSPYHSALGMFKAIEVSP